MFNYKISNEFEYLNLEHIWDLDFGDLEFALIYVR
jgi:hypothetical protein